MISFDDFLIGVVQDYLLTCEARLYAINTELLTSSTTLINLDPYELNRSNGYEPRQLQFPNLPLSTEVNLRQTFSVTAAPVSWSAVGSSLGQASFNYVGVIARVNTTKPRLVYLSPVNPQPSSSGSTINVAAPFLLQAGNTFEYTAKITLANEVNAP